MPGGKNRIHQWEDHLTRKAKSENYPARSVYKLKEIQKKFKIMKKKDCVLDLGCSPGSWMLYAAEVVGKNGHVRGIDLKTLDISLPDNVTAIQDDIFHIKEKDCENRFQKMNVVLSDMAPATTGRKDIDALRSFELCEKALQVAENFLLKNGHFVCKIFQGKEFSALQKKVTAKFKSIKIFKPVSCRKHSKEIYIIAKGKK